MNYELAKRLKDAGFPQEGSSYYYEGTTEHSRSIESDYFNNGFNEEIFVADPTLEELIEACGMNFDGLIVIEKFYASKERVWNAKSGSSLWELGQDNAKDGYGKTPETAVAKLWLELNK